MTIDWKTFAGAREALLEGNKPTLPPGIPFDQITVTPFEDWKVVIVLRYKGKDMVVIESPYMSLGDTFTIPGITGVLPIKVV